MFNSRYLISRSYEAYQLGAGDGRIMLRCAMHTSPTTAVGHNQTKTDATISGRRRSLVTSKAVVIGCGEWTTAISSWRALTLRCQKP